MPPFLPGVSVRSTVFQPDLLTCSHAPHCPTELRPGRVFSAALYPVQPRMGLCVQHSVQLASFLLQI